jgi:hypothetical protein
MEQDDAYKRAKEAFVADLHGTSAREVFALFALMPVRPSRSKLDEYSPRNGLLTGPVVPDAGHAVALLGAHAAAGSRGHSPCRCRELCTSRPLMP